jgi:methanogenic corrinoid protein MtbC1
MTRIANDQGMPMSGSGRYTQALLDGEDDAAFEITEVLLRARFTLGGVYLHLLTPALAAVGQMWCDGDIGVGLENWRLISS